VSVSEVIKLEMQTDGTQAIPFDTLEVKTITLLAVATSQGGHKVGEKIP